jgi:CO dehydrogenase/acetyl-CoA synthase alpha subunit
MDLKKKISFVKKILKRNYIIIMASCFIFAMKL